MRTETLELLEDNASEDDDNLYEHAVKIYESLGLSIDEDDDCY